VEVQEEAGVIRFYGAKIYNPRNLVVMLNGKEITVNDDYILEA
jgi:hypothetical protein|tara:strand:- start:583 stop:711 length:129 start_codon:yes stop_codon:yes gene_type:complete